MNSETAWTTARDFVFAYEGGFQSNPNDKGNWTGGDIGKGELKGTKYGISAASYPDLSIQSLTQEQAEAIYKRDYWDANHCGDMPARFAIVMFDASILQGVAGAAFCLQRALKVAQDGKVGPNTLSALAIADGDTDDKDLLDLFAQRAVAEDKIFASRPSMLLWAGNWELRMFKLARLVFGPTFAR